jgi:hypothetical protein
MTLLGVVDNLIHRIESHQNAEIPEDSVLEVRTGNQELDESSDDLAELENLEYTLKEGLGGVENDFKVLVNRWTYRMVCFLPPFPTSSSIHFSDFFLTLKSIVLGEES